LQKLTQSCTLIIGDYNDHATWIVLFNKERLPMAASPPRKKRKPAIKSARDGGQKEAASFIAEQLADLARLARRHELNMLGFLLDMGLMEAKEIVGRRGRPRRGAGRRSRERLVISPHRER
jgi:hypothetical protein